MRHDGAPRPKFDSAAVSSRPAPADQSATRNNLDAVRLFLALNVAVGHGCHYWLAFDYRYGMAVSIFLGISGYLVLQSRYNSVSAAHFAWKRFLRIYPLMIVTVVVGAQWLDRQLSQVVIYLLTAGLRGDSMLGPGWTIIVEELMYGVLLVLFAFDSYTRSWLIALLMAASVATTTVFYFEVSPEIQRIVILPANFFLGNLLYMHRARLALHYRTLTLPCACISCGYMFNLYTPTLPPYMLLLFHVLAQFMGIIACIGFGVHARPVFARLRSVVGDLSYSLYLVHSLLLAYLIGHPLSSNVRTFALFVWASLLLSLVSWRFLENPALRLRDVPVTLRRGR